MTKQTNKKALRTTSEGLASLADSFAAYTETASSKILQLTERLAAVEKELEQMSRRYATLGMIHPNNSDSPFKAVFQRLFELEGWKDKLCAHMEQGAPGGDMTVIQLIAKTQAQVDGLLAKEKAREDERIKAGRLEVVRLAFPKLPEPIAEALATHSEWGVLSPVIERHYTVSAMDMSFAAADESKPRFVPWYRRLLNRFA